MTGRAVARPRPGATIWRCLWLASLACLVAFLGYGLVSPATGAKTGTLANTVAFIAFVLAFSTVGALIASKRPANPIGWLLLAAALCFAVGGVGVSLPARSGGELSPALLAQWAGSWAWGLGIGLAILVLLHFPDGRIPSRRWRPALWLTVGAMLAYALEVGFGSPVIGDGPVPNPFALSGPVGAGVRALPVAFPLIFVAGLLAVGSVVVRWRRAGSVERHQIKWLLSAALLVGIGIVVAALVTPPEATDASNAILTGTFACLPIGIGIAVLRYRLYEIDRVISRTLLYAIVTLVLAAAYLCALACAEAALAPLAAGGGSIAVAASTLAVAALFAPVRRQVQDVLDRRFNRARYDAKRSVDAFAARVRDEVDLGRLGAEVVVAIEAALEPDRVAVWLRPRPR